MTATTPSVLFVCVHNAGRSQMAAGWLTALAGPRIEVHSAGSAPAHQINPVVVQAMKEVGVDISNAQPQSLTNPSLERADLVITMGCGDACPVIPGSRYEDWQLPDPAGQSITVVRQIRDQIRLLTQELANRLLAPASPGQP